MPKQYEFTTRFSDQLLQALQHVGHRSQRDYDLGEQLPTSHRIRAPIDLIIQTLKTLVFIEIEIHRADPSNNIAKIAYCLQHLNTAVDDAHVIQWFSSHYTQKRTNRDTAKKVLAQYLGNTLLRNRYHPLNSSIPRPVFEAIYEQFEKGRQTDVRRMEPIVDDAYTQITTRLNEIIS